MPDIKLPVPVIVEPEPMEEIQLHLPDVPEPDPEEIIEVIRDLADLRLQPPRNDPRHNDFSVPPGQTDVPAGGTSGSEICGGRRRK